jgi:hypothetical protein
MRISILKTPHASRFEKNREKPFGTLRFYHYRKVNANRDAARGQVENQPARLRGLAERRKKWTVG